MPSFLRLKQRFISYATGRLEVEAVEAVLLRLERFMIKVWADKREPNTSLWPAFLEEELDNAMNDLADTKLTKSLTKALYSNGIFKPMEDKIDYSVVKVADLQKGLVLAPKMGAPHTPIAKTLMETGSLILRLRQAQTAQPSDYEEIRLVISEAKKLRSHMNDKSKAEIDAAKIALQDNDITKVLIDAVAAFHEGTSESTDSITSSQIEEKKAETPRLRRSYSAEVMSNAQEFDLQTIDVSIISKALKASRRIGKATSREARSLFECVEGLRDLRRAMKENDWMKVKVTMDRMHALPDGIHNALVIEVGFAQMQLQLYQNVIELQKAGQGGAALCEWGFIDVTSIGTTKLGDAIDLANKVDRKAQRVEDHLNFSKIAPKHVHEHVDSLVKEAVATLEVRQALQKDSRRNEIKLKEMLAPYAGSQLGPGGGRRGSVVEYQNPKTFRFGPELEVYADEVRRRGVFRSIVDEMKKASTTGDVEAMKNAMLLANECRIERCPNLHFVNAIDWALENTKQSLMLLDAFERGWNSSSSLKRIIADAERGHWWVHKMPKLEEARLRVNVVTEVENAITKALTLFRQEDVREAVRLAEKDDCTAVTGYELVHRVSRLGHRSLAHIQMWAAVQKEDLGSLLEVVLRTRKPLFKTRREHDDYDISNIPDLRAPSDFAQRMMLESIQIRTTMLTAQRGPLPTSLTTLSPAHANFACRLFRHNLLGWTGLRKFSHPEMLASEWLRVGLAMPEIRDELYCQLMKQLNVPLPGTQRKLWLLFLLSLESWPPSGALQSFVEFYLIKRGNQQALRTLHFTIVRYHMESIGYRDPTVAPQNSTKDELLEHKASVLSPDYILTRLEVYHFEDSEGLRTGKEHLDELAAEADRLEAERAVRFEEWKVRFSKLSDDADALLDMRSFTQCIDRNSARILPRDMLVIFFLIRGDVMSSLRPTFNKEEMKDKGMGLKRAKKKDKSMEFDVDDVAPFWSGVVKLSIFENYLIEGKLGAEAYKAIIVWGQREMEKVRDNELCDVPIVRQRQLLIEEEEERAREEQRKEAAYVERIIDLFKKKTTPKFERIYSVLRQKLKEAKKRVKYQRFRTRRSGIGAIRDANGTIDRRLSTSNVPNSFRLLDIANKAEQEKVAKRAARRKSKGLPALGEGGGSDSETSTSSSSGSEEEEEIPPPPSQGPANAENNFPQLPLKTASKLRPGELEKWGWRLINRKVLKAFSEDHSEDEHTIYEASIDDSNTITTGGITEEEKDSSGKASKEMQSAPITPTAIHLQMRKARHP
jgi:hypothetical protein